MSCRIVGCELLTVCVTHTAAGRQPDHHPGEGKKRRLIDRCRRDALHFFESAYSAGPLHHHQAVDTRLFISLMSTSNFLQA
jgi:hypothetical protein